MSQPRQNDSLASLSAAIPCGAEHIIRTLETNGHSAYVVGGCVRDAILGTNPHDWDICTSATTDQVMACFEGHRVIETGLLHGTVTIFVSHAPYEVTTFRVDGPYSDYRRPDAVEFTTSLEADLSRRDFTINAMAYSPGTGLIDPFSGVADIKTKTIRCVGDADKRFREDALRIMRALRFASVLGFSIDGKTSDALLRNKGLLQNIAAERIALELSGLLTGGSAGEVLLCNVPVIEEVIPEITDMIGFEQNTPYHHLDVWRHTVESVTNSPAETTLRLTMLLHDIAKPQCYTQTGSVGHFYGHPQASSTMARRILSRLRYDKRTIDMVTQLIMYHDADTSPEKKHILRWLSRIGEEQYRRLLAVKKADAAAQSEGHREKALSKYNEILLVLDQIIGERLCFSLKDLAVTGRDLVALGVPEGPEVGAMLKRLLNMVIDEEVDNDKEQLLRAVRQQ